MTTSINFPEPPDNCWLFARAIKNGIRCRKCVNAERKLTPKPQEIPQDDLIMGDYTGLRP